MKKICVIGLGYIGLPTASILAKQGFKVVGVDVKKDLAKKLKRGQVDTSEPGLEIQVKTVIKSGTLQPKTELEPAEVFIICVPTPLTDDHKADLSYVKDATESILPYLRKNNLVILESTVPPGTTREILAPILETNGLEAGKDFYLAHCPERVLPGRILKELVENDRIIGGINLRSAQVAKEIYQTFVTGEIYLTDSETAEMTKLVENSFRDVNIAFANELSRICDHLDVDVWEVIGLANKHPRVNILSPGPGVGGHCTAVDPWFIVQKAPQETQLIKTSREINESMPDCVVEKVEKAIKQAGIKEPIIACLGITYKADVDDLRESPALKIVGKLKDKGYSLRVCDPYVKDCIGLDLFALEEAINGADCVVLLVNHKNFKKLNPAQLLKEMRGNIIIDTRGVWPS